MILYISDTKNSTRKRLETISSFSNVTGYKIDQPKSVVFLCTTNKHTEITFIYNIIASKILTHLGINLNTDTRNFYHENFKSLDKEIEKDRTKW